MDFEEHLTARLEDIRQQGLYRELRPVTMSQGPHVSWGGRDYINFSSNDYLGLADEPALKEAAIRVVQQFGSGSGSSRLVCGSLVPHLELEERLAEFKGTAAALTFSSGYATAAGAIGSLLGKDDIIVVDKLVHASIVDAARLSGAKIRVFRHNDLNDLEDVLRWADQRSGSVTPPAPRPRVLVATESVFSMDGDCAPLWEIVELKNRFGAWLMLDEAHATGLFGPNRRGLSEELEVAEQIEVQMGTLGKALGAAGGYIVGSRQLIELLVNRARPFIFSTAPVPAAAAAACAGIEFVRSAAGEERRQLLWRNLKALPRDLVPSPASAIIPIILGAEDAAVRAAGDFQQAGLFCPAIRFPTVARGRARLRITLCAKHSPEDLRALTAELRKVLAHASFGQA